MKLLKLIAVLSSVLFLSGCIRLWQDNVEIKTYMIQVSREGAAFEEPIAGKLWIEDIHVLPPYNIRSLISRESDVAYKTSYYSELLMSPSENFQNGFYTWLSDSGMFETVSMVDRKGMSHRLVATVVEFYGDRSTKEAVLRMKISLFDGNEKEMNVLLHQDYEQRIAVSEENAESFMRAYNTGLTEILSAFEADVVEVLRPSVE